MILAFTAIMQILTANYNIQAQLSTKTASFESKLCKQLNFVIVAEKNTLLEVNIC